MTTKLPASAGERTYRPNARGHALQINGDINIDKRASECHLQLMRYVNQ